MNKAVTAILICASLPGIGAAQAKEQDEVAALRSRVAKAARGLSDALPVVQPFASSNVPSAYGGTLGMAGLGVSFQSRTRRVRSSDGAAALILPVGSPRTGLGVDLSVTALELNPFGRRGSFGVKLHRLLADGSSVAAGVENLGVWGFSDVGQSWYAVYGRSLALGDGGARLRATAGIGTGRFRRDRDIASGRTALNFMGSLGVEVHPQASFFGEWNGNSLNAGFSIAPAAELPLVATFAWQDLNRSGRDRGRFSLGLGMAFFF